MIIMLFLIAIDVGKSYVSSKLILNYESILCVLLCRNYLLHLVFEIRTG